MPKRRTFNFPTKLSIPESAEFWGVSISSAWRIVKAGLVPSHRIGTRRFVYLSDAEKYVVENTLQKFDAQQIASKFLANA